MPEVDHFLGTSAYVQLGDLLAAAEAAPASSSQTRTTSTTPERPRSTRSPKYTAYLKISEGCDNACAFCIIPTLRGAQRSRPIDDILAEAQQSGGLRRARAEPGGAGPDRLRARPAGQAQAARAAAGAVHGGRAVDSPALRLPARLPRRADRRPGERAEGGEVPGHAAAARLRPAACGPCGAGGTAPSSKRWWRSCAPACRGSTFRTSLIVGLPGETDGGLRGAEGLRPRQRFERMGCFRYSDEEGTAAFLTSRQGADTGHRAALARGDGDAEAHQSRAEPHAHRPAPRPCWWRARAPKPSTCWWAGTRGRRPTSTGRCTSTMAWPTRANSSRVEVTEAHDYDLVGHIVERPEQPVLRRPALAASA